MTDIFSTEKNGDILIVHLNGALDGMSAPYITPDSLLSDGSLKVVLDCTNVSFMDSAGVSAIIGLFKHLSSKDGRMVICSLAEQPKSLIETLKIDSAVSVYGSVEEAVGSF